MKIGGFYEHQLPRPWTRDAEHRLFKDALDQVELADRLEAPVKAARRERISEAAMKRKRNAAPATHAPTVVRAAGHH
ncbi:MAG: hypothetical protein ACREQF_11395 [Candidatus Binataceae bacterium]